MKKTLICATIALSALLISCNASRTSGNAGADAVSSATTSANVPYTIANRYFVRNDVKKLPNGKITNQKDFDNSFGMATVMGENGRPTEIDFDKQYVIAISKPESWNGGRIDVRSLRSDGDGSLILTYKYTEGEKQSYSITPNVVLIVDKKYKGKVELKEE